MWTKQRTKAGDTLSTLALAYGTTVEKILAANGVNTTTQQSDRYLAQQAKAYMLPTNVARSALAKLVMERDIHKWVRSIGGDCEAIREGSSTQIKKLVACPPGYYCRFTSDTAINLPARKRAVGLVTLAGLGATSVMDTVAYLESVKKWAKDYGDWVFSTADDDKKDAAETWRNVFVAGTKTKVDKAVRNDSSGLPSFLRNPSLIQQVTDYVNAKGIEGTRYSTSFAEEAEERIRQARNTLAAAFRAVAEVISPDAGTPGAGTPGAGTPGAGTPGAGTPAPRADTSALAAVRAGTATLKKGAKGAAVTELQTLLRQAGLPVGVDGDFGNNTDRGVKDFQKAKGLATTGIADAATVRALDATVASGGKVAGSGGGGGRRAAPAAVIPEAVPPVTLPPPPQTQAGDKTLIYAASAAAVVIVAAVVLKARGRAA